MSDTFNRHAAPLVVGLGGTLRAGSSTERVLKAGLAAAKRHGARTQLFGGADIDLPMYAPEGVIEHPGARRLIEALRSADAVLVATPGYHGGISGLVKNALDYVEEMRGDPASYFDGKTVGCIVTAAGAQAGVTTLAALRSVVHALRGWPTPLGITVNTAEPVFDAEGGLLSAKLSEGLDVMASQMVGFGRLARFPPDLAAVAQAAFDLTS